MYIPKEFKGSFDIPDDRAEDIWEICVKALNLIMEADNASGTDAAPEGRAGETE